MGIIVATREQIEEYFASDRLSQSKLKKLLGGLDEFTAEERESGDKPHFLIGSGVDILLTGNKGDFESQFHVSQMEKRPSDTIMSIVGLVFTMVVQQWEEENRNREEEYSFQSFLLDTGNELSIYDEYILEACDEHQYQMRWKTETRISKIIEEGSEYFLDLQESQGKSVLDTEQAFKINSIVRSFRESETTGKYFDRNDETATSQRMDIYYQMPLYFEYRGIKCKALLDRVAITKDEDGKIIRVFPFDVKTISGSTLMFPSSVSGRRYDIQAAWYTLALTLALNLKHEQIAPFEFLVESTTKQGDPLVFACEESLLDQGRFGKGKLFLEGSNGMNLLRREVLGFENLLDDYIWYSENGWERERKIVENKGFFKLDHNGIV